MSLDSLWQQINKHYLIDEAQVVKQLLAQAEQMPLDRKGVCHEAAACVEAIRSEPKRSSLHDAFMREYDLSSDEGIILMALAEALLRIPDSATSKKLIHDYLAKGNWVQHIGHSPSKLINLASWGLKLSSRLATMGDSELDSTWQRLANRLSMPVLEQAIERSMAMLGHQFIMGETMPAALNRSGKQRTPQLRHSFDMLGEAALCEEDVARYFEAYRSAIEQLAAERRPELALMEQEGISIKLSALHARYEFTQRERVINELTPRVRELVMMAKEAGISLTLDAEECDRLELSLEIFEEIYSDPQLEGWQGFGLAVQAYQKRAFAVVEWLAELSNAKQRVIPVRLVKGAYWDSEIKGAQQLGLDGYPVFTRKQNTDLSYLVCAQKLISAPYIYCQFATHNAHTVLGIANMAAADGATEFQRLHGMGEALYEWLNESGHSLPVRVYAPVGGYHELLPYLVRRMLENGANSSFVNRIWDAELSAEEVVADPISYVTSLASIPHSKIATPADIFGPGRKNSPGINLSDTPLREALLQKIDDALQLSYQVTPLGEGLVDSGQGEAVINPASTQQIVGHQAQAGEEELRSALESAAQYQSVWGETTSHYRGQILLRMANLLIENQNELLGLITKEAGRTLDDGISEIREAVDFCRYYAQLANEQLREAIELPGPVGEDNSLRWAPKGVFVAISPWNFPVAIFIGQVAAALAAGNCVLAKPAHQTPILAMRVVELLYQAGVPKQALYLLPTRGSLISKHLLSDSRIAGVAFTGSTETAKTINQTLAARSGPIATLIAETGGQNVMIVDSSALAERVVKDALRSAFNSAGQRCSALRVMFVQEEIASTVIKLLKGAMAELVIGDPANIHTDVGPVIDEEAYDKLVLHAAKFEALGKLLYQTPLPQDLPQGYYVAPSLIEITSLDELPHEVFGPMLHVVSYKSSELEQVMAQVNGCGYGLTLGVHSRVESNIETIERLAHVGNLYVNRDMVGAVVGVQPFGGEGLSGTGFKAGGPHYLYRFCTERSVSINSAAIGGNTQLLNLEDNN